MNKREAIEGGVITVNCSVPEENPPIHFTVEKLKLDEKDFKETREKVSQNQNFMVVEFTVEEEDHVIFFQCQARIFSGTNVEMSEATKSDMVTVTGQSPILLFITLWFAGLGMGRKPRN